MENKAVKIGENRAEAHLSVKWEDLKVVYDKLMNKYQKQITLHGFRKGKTPLSVLENKIGDDVLRESAYEAMNNSMTELFENIEKDLRPLPYSQPEIVDGEKLVPFKKNEDIDFTIRFDIVPDVKIDEYKGLSIEIPNVVISDEMVNQEIERYRMQNSIIKPKGDDKQIENSDLVTLDYEVIEKDKENKKIDDFTFTVGEKKNIYQFDDDVLGLKEGDEKEFTKSFNNEEVKIRVKIKTIKIRELPEVDDEFAQDIKSEYKTVEDLKNGIRKQFTDDLDDRMKETKIVAVCDKILEKTDIDLPKAMIEYEVEINFRRTASQYNMSPSDFEKFLSQIGQSKVTFVDPWRKDVEKTIKRKLIVSKVEELENIKADEEKVKAMIEKQTPEGSDENTKKAIEESIRDQMGFSAAIDFLIENNNLKKKKEEVTYEDFVSGKYLKKEKDGKDNKAENGEIEESGGKEAADSK